MEKNFFKFKFIGTIILILFSNSNIYYFIEGKKIDMIEGGYAVIEWVKTYEQPNKFNEEIIYNLRENDNMVDYLVDVCKALETIPYIKFDDYELITDENKFKKKDWLPVNDSRLSLINLRFTITFKDEVEKINMPIFIPKLINRYYYILNGNKYYAIYQNVDSSTYNTKDSCILKSLLMPIILKRERKKVVDAEGVEHNGYIYLINLFKHKANILYYFFSVMGYTKTVEYFGFRDKVFLISKSGTPPKNNEKFIYFLLNKNIYLKVDRRKFRKSRFFNSFILCLLDMFNKKTPIEKINKTSYWKIKLGSIFTKNSSSQLEKAETVLLSFRRILDDRTKKILRIPEEDKEDIFALIRWMVKNFNKLIRKDNLSLTNKRLRLSEYQITPFVRKMSTNTYRILNSKVITMVKLKSIFRINPMTIIADLQKSELLRYNNAVNDMDLFNCALKFSNRGPSSIGEGSRKTISIFYRGVHPSHVGRLSLNSCSAGDPGMSGTLSPFIKTSGFYYTDKELTEEE